MCLLFLMSPTTHALALPTQSGPPTYSADSTIDSGDRAGFRRSAGESGAVGILARLDRFLGLSGWAHAVIIAAWLAFTVAVARTRDRSRLTLLIAAGGLLISVLFSVVSVIGRTQS